MKAFFIAGLGLLSLAAVAQTTWTSGSNPAISAKESSQAVDSGGNLQVPDDYRTAYQFLGSWAIAANQGQGSKEMHNVYASPGTIAAYHKNGRFPDGSVLVKEVFETATGAMTTGVVSHAQKLNPSYSAR